MAKVKKPLEVKVRNEVYALTSMSHDQIVIAVLALLKEQKIPQKSLMSVMVEDGVILVCTTVKILKCNKRFKQVELWQGNPTGSTVGSNCYGHFLRALS